MTVDTDTLYKAYQANPNSDTLNSVVTSLAPTINYALASVNASDDPLVRSKAKIYTANAIEKYNPEHAGGANLATHVSSQLKQLSRAARQSKSPVRIPERAHVEAYQLSQARKRFADTHGRDPDTLELADFTGVPVKRIEKVNQFQVSMPSETTFGGELEHESPDFAKDALEYIFHASDHTDRKILEMKLGYGGNKPVSPQEVGEHLNLTPSQLSRRSMRLAKRIQEVQAALEQQ